MSLANPLLQFHDIQFGVDGEPLVPPGIDAGWSCRQFWELGMVRAQWTQIWRKLLRTIAIQMGAPLSAEISRLAAQMCVPLGVWTNGLVCPSLQLTA